MVDLVISGGTLVDGSGEPPRRGDVAIAGERIVAVGDVGPVGEGVETVDASGLIVTPGWVDIHTHYDGQVTWDGDLAPSSVNGVTSVVLGNCGVGFAPARPDRHDWLIALLEGVEDIPGTALAEGLSWGWESFVDYLDVLDDRRWTVDVGTQMPHAALRTYVMGDRGADHSSVATADETALMRELTRAAVEAGALGFTTSPPGPTARRQANRSELSSPTPTRSSVRLSVFATQASVWSSSSPTPTSRATSTSCDTSSVSWNASPSRSGAR